MKISTFIVTGDLFWTLCILYVDLSLVFVMLGQHNAWVKVKMKTFEETADLLAQLYDRDFNGKRKGRFRIARTTFAMLAGRQNIEQLSVDQVRLWLSEKHGLMLIDMYDEIAIIKSSIFRRYRKATNGVLKDVLGISIESDEIDEDE